MIFEGFSRPKARDLSVMADDVLLHLPGRMTAVFDGASDSLGRRIDGVPVGRLAALAAARAASALPLEAGDWPVEDILPRLSTAIADDVPTEADEGPASTTAMIAFERPDGVRLVGIGDTGYRINGQQSHVQDLAPDGVTIPARVAAFRILQGRGEAVETCEVAARMVIGQGLDRAIEDGVLTKAEADKVTRSALEGLTGVAAEEALDLLGGGIQKQHRLANAPDKNLAYGVLNGAVPDLRFAIDRHVDKTALRSIEIFSDGYLRLPDDVSIAAWEALHADIERLDPHKTQHELAVKGSTRKQFFDDRTVAILRHGGAG